MPSVARDQYTSPHQPCDHRAKDLVWPTNAKSPFHQDTSRCRRTCMNIMASIMASGSHYRAANGPQSVIDENPHHLESGYTHMESAHDRRTRRCFSQVCILLKVLILSNYANILLVIVPFAIMAAELNVWGPIVFILSLVAVIPLGTTLSFAIKQLSLGLNDTMGALLTAISGNSVELIICLIALNEGRLEEVQAFVLGSLLMNLLLVTGSSFFLGGIFNMRDQSGDGVEQNFASAMVHTARSFMIMSVAFLAFPASLDMMASKADFSVRYHAILTLSRGTAIIVLLLYFLYLFFQLRTHPDLFSTQISYKEDVDDYAVMNVYTAALLAVAAACLTALCAYYFMCTLYDVLPPCSFGPSFLLIFPVPVISNAAELIRAIYLAIQDKMDLAMGIATGSCIQISLFTTPFLVIIAWAVFDQPMNFNFKLFETMALAFSVLVAYTAQEGRSNYLQGAMMIGLYSIMVLAYLVLPGDALDACNT